MRVVVDFDLCESNAVCMGIAPEVFEVRDDDFLYVLDETPPEELRQSLWRAAQGDPVFSPSLAALVLGEFRRMAKASGPVQPLSEREREVLQHVARRHTYREIGEELFISQKTVENHVRNILGKLHLNRKQELIRYALEHGIE